MKITKFGHCCLLVEEAEIRILTDPGTYSIQQNDVKNIDIVLITHEHSDHLHIDSLKQILKNNPLAKVATNSDVGALLEKEGLASMQVEDGLQFNVGGVDIKVFGKEHALMHASLPPIQNSGFLIANRLYYPGDALTKPTSPVEILALPVAGPWLRLLDSIDYALEIKPKVCFPVHEGILKSPGSTHRIPAQILGPNGITFNILEIDKEYEF